MVSAGMVFVLLTVLIAILAAMGLALRETTKRLRGIEEMLRLRPSRAVPERAVPVDSMNADVVELVRRGKYSRAVVVYRARHGCSLRESEAAVNEMRARSGAEG